MPSAETMLAFALASVALLVIPGPAVIFVLNRSVADGREAGLAAVAGLEVGNLCHMIAAAAGLSAVLAASATAFNAVKWVGAGYLVLVGIRTLLTAPVVPDGRSGAATSPARAFRQGVVVNVLNPKVALFFLSFLPQFIDPGVGPAWSQALVLGMIFVGLGAITDGAYALTASTLRQRLVGSPALPFIQRYVAGAVFVGLGVVAATAVSPESAA